MGIIFSDGIGNTLSNNICDINENVGISISSSNDNIIEKNQCGYNDYDGISMRVSDGNTLSNNICNNNENVGISISSSNDNIIEKNRCLSNFNDGISLITNSEGNVFSTNVCNNNGRNGISIGYSESLENMHVERNVFKSNTCNNNGEYGIYIDQHAQGTIFSNNDAESNGIDDFHPPFLNENPYFYLWIILLVVLLLVLIFAICLLIHIIRSKGNKDKISIFMEIKTDMTLNDIWEFLSANFPKEKIGKRNNKMYGGSIGTPVFSLLKIYDYKTYRLVSGWSKGWDAVKEIILAFLLILLIIPTIIMIIWVIIKRKTIKKMLVAIKEKDAGSEKQ